jgi:uncharacterized phage protein gp47/JayE
MAKIPNLKTELAFAKTFRERMQERSGLTHWGYDSVTRILNDTLTGELAVISKDARDSFKSMQLSTAKGSDLEALGEMYGVQRLPPAFANVSNREQNLMLFVKTGTFGDINGGADILVPAGTLISSHTLGAATNRKAMYRTTTQYILSAGDRLAYCSARAETSGSTQNVTEQTLTYHGFSGYLDSASNSLSVTNKYSILNGQDIEADEQLRFRIASQYSSIIGNNIEKIKLMALEVPGIIDVRVVPGYYGIGTAACFTFGIDEESNTQLANSLQSKLRAIQGPGLKIVAQPGVCVRIDFELRVAVNKELNAAQKKVMINNIKKALFQGIKNESTSREINLSNLSSMIMRNDRSVVRLISNKYSASGFEGVYIRRMTGGTATVEDRHKIIKNRFNLDKEEFAALGQVSVEFEVDA